MSVFSRKINFSLLLLIVYFLYSKGSPREMSYSITKLWDNTSVPDTDRIDLKLQYIGENNDLEIRILAPFYDDPKIPEKTPIGSMNQLWNYEVVEVFLLGEDNHYLEMEFGPKGQYILLQLHGYRNVTKMGLTLTNFSAHISDNRWTGIAVIPSKYIPTNVTKFNAYAIHGSDPHRKYLSLFATPSGKYKDPDFHRLDYFGNFDLKLY